MAFTRSRSAADCCPVSADVPPETIGREATRQKRPNASIQDSGARPLFQATFFRWTLVSSLSFHYYHPRYCREIRE